MVPGGLRGRCPIPALPASAHSPSDPDHNKQESDMFYSEGTWRRRYIFST